MTLDIKMKCTYMKALSNMRGNIFLQMSYEVFVPFEVTKLSKLLYTVVCHKNIFEADKDRFIYRCELLLSYTSNTDFGFHQF